MTCRMSSTRRGTAVAIAVVLDRVPPVTGHTSSLHYRHLRAAGEGSHWSIVDVVRASEPAAADRLPPRDNGQRTARLAFVAVAAMIRYMELSGIRNLTRAGIHDIWRKYKGRSDELTATEKLMGDILADHTEYHAVWSMPPEATGREVVIDGVNPFLHVSLHMAVEEQLVRNDPPEVAETLAAIITRGRTRHEALHQIAEILREQMADSFRRDKPFNPKNYAWKLGRLK
jgi:hypothetical protein